jgi:hypothetical protein
MFPFSYKRMLELQSTTTDYYTTRKKLTISLQPPNIGQDVKASTLWSYFTINQSINNLYYNLSVQYDTKLQTKTLYTTPNSFI